MKKILISDVTLRDGNHAINHAVNKNIAKDYANFAENCNLDILEVGHGNGIGASSLSIGRSRVSDEQIIKIVRKNLKKTKLSIHSIPGFSKISDLQFCIDHGVDIFRIGCNSPDIDIIQKQVNFCKKNKVEVWAVLMMFHLIYNDKNEYLKKIKFLKEIGIKTIIIMDSAGCLIPDNIKDIFSSLKKFNLTIGFHGHNNYNYGIANSIEAIKNGAKIIDASIRGFGAGAGNAQLEILITILDKFYPHLIKKYNKEILYEMAENFPNLLKKNNINYMNAFSEPMNILSAEFGLFSGFASKVNFFSKKMNVRKIDLFKEIGKKKLVAGQEDLIMNIIYNLKNSK